MAAVYTGCWCFRAAPVSVFAPPLTGEATITAHTHGSPPVNGRLILCMAALDFNSEDKYVLKVEFR